jgi:hypothetical protein
MEIHPHIYRTVLSCTLCAGTGATRSVGWQFRLLTNSALWLKNLDSLSVRFHQILISRLICKRAIAVQNLGVPQRRRPRSSRPFRDGTGIFFLKLGFLLSYKSDQNSKLSSVDNVPSHHSGAQGRDVAGCKRSGAAAKAGWLCS